MKVTFIFLSPSYKQCNRTYMYIKSQSMCYPKIENIKTTVSMLITNFKRSLSVKISRHKSSASLPCSSQQVASKLEMLRNLKPSSVAFVFNYLIIR